jgi:hypothetical protein
MKPRFQGAGEKRAKAANFKEKNGTFKLVLTSEKEA